MDNQTYTERITRDTGYTETIHTRVRANPIYTDQLFTIATETDSGTWCNAELSRNWGGGVIHYYDKINATTRSTGVTDNPAYHNIQFIVESVDNASSVFYKLLSKIGEKFPKIPSKIKGLAYIYYCCIGTNSKAPFIVTTVNSMNIPIIGDSVIDKMPMFLELTRMAWSFGKSKSKPTKTDPMYPYLLRDTLKLMCRHLTYRNDMMIINNKRYATDLFSIIENFNSGDCEDFTRFAYGISKKIHGSDSDAGAFLKENYYVACVNLDLDVRKSKVASYSVGLHNHFMCVLFNKKYIDYLSNSEQRVNELNSLAPSLVIDTTLNITIKSRTSRYQNSFFPYCTSQWNSLDSELRNLPSVASFKHALASFYRRRVPAGL